MFKVTSFLKAFFMFLLFILLVSLSCKMIFFLLNTISGYEVLRYMEEMPIEQRLWFWLLSLYVISRIIVVCINGACKIFNTMFDDNII